MRSGPPACRVLRGATSTSAALLSRPWASSRISGEKVAENSSVWRDFGNAAITLRMSPCKQNNPDMKKEEQQKQFFQLHKNDLIRLFIQLTTKVRFASDSLPLP